jgi:tRNA(fMet)-specific endonuclease VapC
VTATQILLLDTNILIHLVRDNRIGRSIDARFRLRSGIERPLISIVTVGEALAFARKLNWGPSKTAILEDLFENAVVIVDISKDEVLRTYAEIEDLLRRKGRPIEQNDIWIAATAIASGAHLLTTDKDFDPLYPKILDRTWIDPQQPDA